MTDKAKDTYIKFLGGSTEATVWCVKLSYSLVKKLELVTQYGAKTKTNKDNKTLIITASSPSDEIQGKEDLEEENKTLLEEMTTLKKEYWALS